MSAIETPAACRVEGCPRVPKSGTICLFHSLQAASPEDVGTI